MSKLVWAFLAGMLVNHAALADYGQDWSERNSSPRWKQRDYATIRHVTPQYEQVSQPRQECTSEWISENVPRNNNYAGTMIGGVAGGVLGHQVGKGRGKDVATVAGTLIGAMVGNHLADTYGQGRPVDSVQREVQRCRQVNDYSQRVRDYRVDYEYRSQIYSSTMTRYPGNPGARIPVKVLVELDD